MDIKNTPPIGNQGISDTLSGGATGGGSIDEPGAAQPSLGRSQEPETGTRGLANSSGSLDTPADDPVEGSPDITGDEVGGAPQVQGA